MFFIYPGFVAAAGNDGASFLTMIRNAGLGDRNLALVADPYRQNYERGVSADIPDFASLLDWHKRLLQSLPHVTEFYHLGTSSGGYGALLFGRLLGANKVWAFAPRTARLTTADAAKAFLKKQLLAGTGATEYVIYYSPANTRDRAFAEYFSQCPGVVLSPYNVPPPDRTVAAETSPAADEKHYHGGVFATIVGSGELRQIVPAFRRAATCGKAPAKG
jgi:hypothetical protein